MLNFLGWISSFPVMAEMSSLHVFFRSTSIFVFFGPEGGGGRTMSPMHIDRKYHISTRFLIKIIFFHFPHKEKIPYFLERINTIFSDITKKIVFWREFPGKTIFPEHLKKISHFQVFFGGRSSFLLCLNYKNIFSGKRNIIFPHNTKKIISQCDFFGKTIFSKHLEKENMVFRAVILIIGGSGTGKTNALVNWLI